MKGKRLLVVLLALIFALTSFTACGLFGKDKDKNPSKNTEQNSEQNPGKDTEKEEAKPVALTDKALAGDMLIDFTKGADASVVFESDGWTNGDVFNVVWAKNNVKYENGKMLLSIVKEDKKAWLGEEEVTFPYTAGEARTQNYFGYGDYTVKMKPSANLGTASTFFICTGNYDSKYVLDENGNVVYNEDGTIKSEPNRHDEIDIEFLGKDTTKVQFNFFVNGKGGNEYMYDLGFDASKEYHEYGFRWEETSITWFVDGKPVYKVTTDKTATAGTNVRIVDELPYTPGRILMSHWCGNEGAYGWMGEYAGNTKDNGCEYEWVKTTTKGAPLNPEITTPDADPENSGTATVPEVDWSKVTAIKPTFESTDVYTVTNKDTTSNVKYSAVGGSTYINVEMDITAVAKNTNTLHLTLKNNGKKDVQIRVNVIDAELLAKGAQNASTNKMATMNGATIFTDLEWGGSFFDIKAGETVDAVISFTGAVEKLQLMIDSSRNDSETRSGDVTISDIKFSKQGEIVDENTVGEYKINPIEKIMKATRDVNVRNLPKKIGDKLGYLKKGEVVLVTGQCKQTKWYRIVFKDGQVGYVTPEYLTDAAAGELPAPSASNSIFINSKEYTFAENGYVLKSSKDNKLNVKYDKVLGGAYGNIAADITGLSVDYNKLTLKVTNNGKETVKLRIDVNGEIIMCKDPDGGDMKASNLYATQDGAEVYTDLEWGGSKFEIAAGKTSTLEIIFDASKKAQTLLVFIDSSDYLETGKNVYHSGDITLSAVAFGKGTAPVKPEEPSKPETDNSGSQGGTTNNGNTNQGTTGGTTGGNTNQDTTTEVQNVALNFSQEANTGYTLDNNSKAVKTINVKYSGKGNTWKPITAEVAALAKDKNTFSVKITNNSSADAKVRVDVQGGKWIANPTTAEPSRGTDSTNVKAVTDVASDIWTDTGWGGSHVTVKAKSTIVLTITYDGNAAQGAVKNILIYTGCQIGEDVNVTSDITFSEFKFYTVGGNENQNPPAGDNTGSGSTTGGTEGGTTGGTEGGTTGGTTGGTEGGTTGGTEGGTTGGTTGGTEGGTTGGTEGGTTGGTTGGTEGGTEEPTEPTPVTKLNLEWFANTENVTSSAANGAVVESLRLEYSGAKLNYGAQAKLSPNGDITGFDTFTVKVTNHNSTVAKIRIDLIIEDGNSITRSTVTSARADAAEWCQPQADGFFVQLAAGASTIVEITYNPETKPTHVLFLPALMDETDAITADVTFSEFEFSKSIPSEKMNLEWYDNSLSASTTGQLDSVTFEYTGTKQNWGAQAKFGLLSDITDKDTFSVRIQNNGSTPAKVRIDLLLADGTTRSTVVSVSADGAWYQEKQDDGYLVMIGNGKALTAVITYDPATKPVNICILPALGDDADTITANITVSEFKFYKK